MPLKGYRQTEEHKQRHRDSITDETRQRMSKSGKSKPPVTEETRQKLRMAQLGKKASEETKQTMRDSQVGKVFSKAHRQKLSEKRLDRMATHPGTYKETKPERELEQRLQEVGLNYEKQKRVGNMLVDFYLPQQNLVIEVDGCWWHSCPKCTPQGGPYADTFLERAVRLNALGYDAIRIWEHEVSQW